MNLSTKLLTIVATLVMPATLFAADGDPDITPEKRLQSATAKIEEKSDVVAVYVKGLVCSSCSIGVKVQLRKLDGVDKSKLEKGVKLDVKTQLVTIALKKGATLNQEQIVKAVSKAGYEAESIFKWNGKKVETIKFVK